MEPFPWTSLTPVKWPKPNKDGSYTLTRTVAQATAALIITALDFIDKQEKRCKDVTQVHPMRRQPR